MKIIDHCEVCGNEHLISVLNLGENPLCDDLIPINSDAVCKKYPIEILFCDKCKTAHQRYQPDKEIVFPDDYHYRAHLTNDVLNGMKNLVDSCAAKFGDLSGKKVVDIGCNDGSLLSFFKEKGCLCTGVEPTGATLEAVKKGHRIYKDYFTVETAEKILSDCGKADFITFTNVFAHIDNLPALIEAVKVLLHEETIVVIENHYLGSVLAKKQFDTFYHEHPRSYSASSFLHIAAQMNCGINDIIFPKRYGGNIRVYLKCGEQNTLSDDMRSRIDAEKFFAAQFEEMNLAIQRWLTKKSSLLRFTAKKYGAIPAKAFPGRAAILAMLLNLNEDIIFAVYEKSDSPKIGHYVPGTRIPILDEKLLFSDAALMKKPLLNFAWHISGEIKSYLLNKGFVGDIIDIIDPGDFD